MMRRRYRYALQRLKQDDPLTIALVKALRKANAVAAKLQDNLEQQTLVEADHADKVAKELVDAYNHSWEWAGTALQDVSEVANNLQQLNDEADRLNDFLEQLYLKVSDVEADAFAADYPEDHVAFQLADKIYEVLNKELD